MNVTQCPCEHGYIVHTPTGCEGTNDEGLPCECQAKTPMWIIQERLRDMAQKAVQYAVARGDLVRPTTCERCHRVAFTYGHHEDYRKPLEVDWLCASCHALVHKRDEWLERLGVETPPEMPTFSADSLRGAMEKARKVVRS